MAEIQVSGVKVGTVAAAFRDLTEGGRYRFAAWNWLRPNRPCPTVADLPGMQVHAGLDHIPAQKFAAKLAEHCRGIARDQGELRRWVRCREAALEFVSMPPVAPPAELADGRTFLQMELTRAMLLSISAPERAASLADGIARTAMAGAARLVNHALGSEGSSVAANLMIPVRRDAPLLFKTPRSNANALMAETLWQGVNAETRLLIVAETKGSSHAGFWVPVVKGCAGEVLPGATRAYLHREGDVVFKDDLPPLSGFCAEVERRWMGFMNQQFTEQLFVSLPFRAPDGAGGHTVPAILNVNVETSDVGRWRRAHHPEWLGVARTRVQAFVEIALGALLLILRVTPGAPALATGSDAWDTLVGVVPRGALEGGST